MSEIIKWEDHQNEPVATCSCGCTEFYLRVDGYGDKWKTIKGTTCVGCGEEINWITVENVSTERVEVDGDSKD